MRTSVTISIDHETLEALDAFGQRRDIKRGQAIRELLNIAAGGPRELGTARAAAPDVPGGLPHGVRRGAIPERRVVEVGASGERVFYPFDEES